MKRTRFGQRLAAALGVGVLTALAACGSGGGTSAPTGEPTQTGAVNGGTMTIGVLQEPTSFLAAGITDSMTYSYAVDAPVAEGLLWYRSRDETQNARSIADFWRPDLATEVPTTQNGDVRTSGCRTVTYNGKDQAPKMCVTWKLRSGVLWHDGSRFSSKDVCDTFRFFWLKYGIHNPTNILSPTGWQETIGCDDSSPQQAVLSYRSTYGGYLAQGSGVYGIIPSRLLENAFNGGTSGAGADLEKTPQTVNLTVGSGNPDAYTGTDTLDRIIDGTGPYVFQKYEPAKDIILVRNRRYWDPAHQPHLDRVILKFVSDTKSQLDQARAGEIDFGMDYRLALLKELNDTAAGGKLRVQTIPESGAEKIDLNLCDNAKGLCGDQATKSPFTADLKVRQAMIKAINRQLIVKSIAEGETVVPQDSWIYLGAEFIRTSTTDDPITAYDPVGARRLLDEAGYRVSPSCHGGLGRADSSGRCLDLSFVTTSGNTARQNAQLAVQSDLQKVGIFTNLSDVRSGKLFGSFADGGVLYTHQFQMAMYTNTLSAPAEPDSWYAGYHADCGGSCPDENQIPSGANSGVGQDDTGENNPAVDKLFDQGRSTVDLNQRTRAYRQAETLLAKDLPEIPLYQQVVVNSYTPKLHGLQPNDLVWTFNMYDWWCDGGNCHA
jgi:peptide/nickel transport system substrate-binding protein